ncbi:hypothetical protein Nepgr_017496 [Nepenthes gracilis]|uniref:Uncharacterized protein n=1 Tax=Nepenthes gracilis TaxID=150966 RepID=A0AAD3SRJ0_NEPGR|nr:hypothetical protein Nepgr_017496 [Nepenthes gracilis]
MPSKIKLDTGRHYTLEWTALVEVEYNRKLVWCSGCNLFCHSRSQCCPMNSLPDPDPDPDPSVPNDVLQPNVEAVPSKVCDMEALCRAQLVGDHQMLPFGQVAPRMNILSSVEQGTSHLPLDFGDVPACRFPEDSWSSSSRDSTSFEAVDQLVPFLHIQFQLNYPLMEKLHLLKI